MRRRNFGGIDLAGCGAGTAASPDSANRVPGELDRRARCRAQPLSNLAIYLRPRKALGKKMPPVLLARADEVIE